ncbi:MAG: 50S ribosomal protein L25 [Pseudomonadota bacterium]
MEKLVLRIEARQTQGKNAARALRRRGLIPGVIYGANNTSNMVQIDPKQMRVVLRAGGAENVPFEISMDDGRQTTVMLKEIQIDPVTRVPLHVDLWELTKGKKIEVEVAIHVTGIALGSEKGGILQQVMRALPVECLPEDIPEAIEVDVRGLDIGHSLHVRDLQLPGTLKAKADPEQTVVTCVHPTVTKEAGPGEQGEGPGSEGTAA